VQIRLLDVDQHNRPWRLPVSREARHQFRIRRQPSDTVHPQGVLEPRHEKQQPNAGIACDVAQRIQPVVPRPVRHRQRSRIDDVHKPWLAPARRHIAKPVLARRADAQEGREGNEIRKVRVDLRDVLAHCPAAGLLVNGAKIGLGVQVAHA
jgi:hypothetical protein